MNSPSSQYSSHFHVYIATQSTSITLNQLLLFSNPAANTALKVTSETPLKLIGTIVPNLSSQTLTCYSKHVLFVYYKMKLLVSTVCTASIRHKHNIFNLFKGVLIWTFSRVSLSYKSRLNG